MKQFVLTEETAKGEFELLRSIWIEFKNNPKGLLNGFEIKTNNGIFENFGGFNGNYFDLWLRKRGTNGQTKKTFWRVGLGNNKQFRLFIFDLRFDKCSSKTAHLMADKIGCKVTTGHLQYFVFDDGEPYTTAEMMVEFINNNREMVNNSLIELKELKALGNKEVWQVKANTLIQKVSNNDFRLMKWKEIYNLIKIS